MTPGPGQVIVNLPGPSPNSQPITKESSYRNLSILKIDTKPGSSLIHLPRLSPNPHVIIKVYTNLSKLKIDTRPGSSLIHLPQAGPNPHPITKESSYPWMKRPSSLKKQCTSKQKKQLKLKNVEKNGKD